MRTIVHISDLHFGKINYDILPVITKTINHIRPDVVVVSGDLTQRAKQEEFQEAKAFLSSLPQPQIVVPGNHDVPLYNIFHRVFRPHHKYMQHISETLEPYYADNEIAIIGINTARSLTIKQGSIKKNQIVQVASMLGKLPVETIKIIVSHHPFDIPAKLPDGYRERRIHRATKAVKQLEQYKPDLFLSGHLHIMHTGHTALRYKVKNYSSLVVLGGTATSVRNRREANSFNVLKIAKHAITIQRYVWQPEEKLFLVKQIEYFEKSAKGWLPK